jgi:FkbM family methyltransferase
MFRRFGLNISKFQNAPSPLTYHSIDLVLDVGANIGQYGLLSRAQGYTKKIVSFEPLVEAHTILRDVAKNDNAWVIHERCAVGSENGEVGINISRNSYSSSVLPILESHTNAAPKSVYIGKDVAKLIMLDSVFNNYARESDRVFLKIDTQGYEKQVLDGARECLKHIKGVQLELSVVPLYESQSLYEYFFQFFRDNGFILWSLIPGIVDPKTGQLLQFDAVFISK